MSAGRGSGSRPATPAADDPFATTRAVADAVLYEGYLLYPFRGSSAKNRVRWQFGVLAPRAWIETQQVPDPGVAGAGESWFQQVECLLEAAPTATVRVLLRFLHLERRQLYEFAPDGTRHPVERAVTGGDTMVSFDEALPREFPARFTLADLLAGERTVEVRVPAGSQRRRVGRVEVERTSRPLAARLTVRADRADAPFRLLRLRLRVENQARPADPAAARDEALRDSLIASHLLVGLDGGRVLSLLDPPAWASAAAAGCANQHLFPVLAGEPGRDDALLCSPIILYDHPRIAPESPGDLHDATEIDEILSLRALTLTEEEKREARATDPRAAAIVDRVDALPPEVFARLHGAVRELVDPAADAVLVAGRRVARGSVVELCPDGRGADAHDMFLAGRRATVHAVLRDVDGSVRVAVTVDDDPAAELQDWYGRYFHFRPEEIRPIGVAP